MTLKRRNLLMATLGVGATAAAGSTTRAAASRATTSRPTAMTVNLEPQSARDQTAVLQAAVDVASAANQPLALPPGRYVISDLRLPSGTRLIGASGATTLAFAGGPAFITAHTGKHIMLRDIILDGQWQSLNADRTTALLSLTNCRDIELRNVEFHASPMSGIALDTVSGRVHDCRVHHVLDAGIKSIDAKGLTISTNTVTDCGNNGIQVWRREIGEDRTSIQNNRIERIRNTLGGSGEYGNGVNVFRAGGVLVSGNSISDCAYTAVRGNAANDIQITSNTCMRLGEVAIYAEFGFEGCVISNNVINHAATGISVTNFNEGGRLGVVSGNLIRNLVRREHEPVDKRGIGIGVEADTTVTGNTIENAPTVGIQIGWGAFMRNVSTTGNMIRNAKVGISVSHDVGTGACLLANNLISGARDGAIRQMRFGTVFGPDLAQGPHDIPPLTMVGNVAA